MLKKLWRWLWGEPEPDKLTELLKVVVDNQERSSQMLMNAVAQIGEASQKQAEVLTQYLKLFQSPEDPQRWTRDSEEENVEELRKIGFPEGWDNLPEREQAEWVLKNIERL